MLGGTSKPTLGEELLDKRLLDERRGEGQHLVSLRRRRAREWQRREQPQGRLDTKVLVAGTG